MPNPFDKFKNKNKPVADDYEEWGGMFSCTQNGCDGFATVARFFSNLKQLAWEDQYGHISRIDHNG